MSDGAAWTLTRPPTMGDVLADIRSAADGIAALASVPVDGAPFHMGRDVWWIEGVGPVAGFVAEGLGLVPADRESKVSPSEHEVTNCSHAGCPAFGDGNTCALSDHRVIPIGPDDYPPDWCRLRAGPVTLRLKGAT